ncbi:hypothetical protein [Peribacillus sp. SCS-37]|uniref:hypothetical protein n=1 Tax=Paraperibacillus esterisolvens TaxID=3115296 RepID=UPI0039057BC9
MTIVIICVLAALILVFLLVRVNSRALSSPAEKPADHGDAAAAETPCPSEAVSGEDTGIPGGITADKRQTGIDVLGREQADKMHDDAYRQTLKNFMKSATQPEKQLQRETGIDDTQYRKALSNIKNKKN